MNWAELSPGLLVRLVTSHCSPREDCNRSCCASVAVQVSSVLPDLRMGFRTEANATTGGPAAPAATTLMRMVSVSSGRSRLVT